jgi:hypothetical protein
MLPWVNVTASLETRYSVPGNATLRINAEWFQVFCDGRENYYVQNVVSQDVVDRLEKDKNSGQSVEPPLNLVLFMTDTVSRAQFFRKMRETAKTLESFNATADTEVFQFFRLHTVGHSTEPNTKAMYTGT